MALRLLLVLCYPAILAPHEKCVQFAHGILVHPWQDMRVDVHSHADLRVTEQFLFHLGVDTETEQKSRSTIAQIVKTNKCRSYRYS